MSNRSRLRRLIALATIVGTLGAPAAWAAPFEERVPSAAGNESAEPSGGCRARPIPPSVAPQQVTTVSGDGFSWGDAGIGAAATLALAAIAAGAAVVVTGHRSSRQTVA